MSYRFINEKGEHRHEFNGRPLLGTSTVTGVIAKPLTWWASGLAVAELGWIKPADWRKKPTEEEVARIEKARINNALDMLEKYSGMKPEEYCKLLDKAYAAHSKTLAKAADKGTDMHADLEAYVKNVIKANGVPYVEETDNRAVGIFSEWAFRNIRRFIVSEGHCYSERLWTGGITDCIAEMHNGKTIIIDFKSSKEAYLSQFIQAAGYDIAVSENGIHSADGTLTLKLEQPIDGYAIFPFGAEKVEPQFRWDTQKLKQGFEAATVLYKLSNE